MRGGSFFVLSLLGIAACSLGAPKPVRYVLPSGTVGWVKIAYDRSDGKELAVENGHAVMLISDSLKVTTRNRMNKSWEGSEFYYKGADGKLVRLSSKDGDQRMLWGLEKTSDSDGDREVFFVGKQGDFTKVFNASGDMGTGLLDAKPPDPKTEADRLKVEPDLSK